jgi:CHAT domain-containing protein
LLDDGQYGAAETIAGEWYGSFEAAKTSDSPAGVTAGEFLVESLVRNGHASAPSTLALAEATLRHRERHGGGDGSLVPSLFNLGQVRLERGELEAGRVPLQRALNILRRSAQPASDAIADTLDQLASSFIRAEQFAQAERLLVESLRLREVTASAPARARTVYLQALLLRHQASYTQASKRLEEVRGLQRTLPPNHPERALVAELQGDLSMLAGDAAAAEAGWSSAQELLERTLRPDHPAVARLLRVRGLAAMWDGRLDSARRLFAAALALGRRGLAECHEEYGALLGSAALMAVTDGDYVEARRLQSRALALHERCLGPTHSLTVTAIHNVADVAQQTGDLAEAERLFSRAVRLWSQGLGTDHPYVARGLDSLAEVLIQRNQLQRARDLYTRALSMRQKKLGAEHPDVAWTLMSLARTNAAMGNLATATTQIADAIRIYNRGGTSQSDDSLARAFAFRGDIEMRRASYGDAAASFSQALDLRERRLGANHPLTADARAAFARAQLAVGADEAAFSLAVRSEEAGRDHLRQTIRYLPERHALGVAASRPRGLDVAVSLAVDHAPGERSAAALDALIRSRGVVLDELAARGQVDRTNPALATLAASVAASRQRLAALTYRSLRGDESVSPALLDRARQQKEDLERQLAESAGPGEIVRARIGLEEVRRALPASSALVSFARYDHSARTTVKDRTTLRRTPTYVAFVTRSDSAETHVVALGTAASLERVIEAWRAEAMGRSSAPAAGPAAAERAYRTVGAALRTRVWDPVAVHLQGAARVFIVPDGTLNLVTFASLPIGTDRYLVESGQTIHYLSTERDLVSTDQRPAGRGLLAVGGPSFGGPARKAASELARRSACANAAAVLRFDPLPMALQESQEVARLWTAAEAEPGRARGAVSAEASVLSGPAATERAVADAMRGRRIIHLATHGFFLDMQCTTPTPGTAGGAADTMRTALRSDNPLLLSGLALAGASRTSARDDGDGILTAEEVAALDLAGAEWAVLSACDTGLGEIRAGEGVFGLRRAFQIAGVRTVIMSLWSVQDQATRAWMRELYQARLTNGATTDQAVATASIAMLRERRSARQSTHPFFWAAFVAAGDWR